jgi:PadR family transcriptional regulator PadR
MTDMPNERNEERGLERAEGRRGIERELKRGSLELVVLHLLAPGEAYGYEIVTRVTSETNGALQVTDGTLYPVLYRLERAGFVEVRWETPARGVPRKYYRLTDAGRAELAALEQEWTTFVEAMNRLLRRKLPKEGS